MGLLQDLEVDHSSIDADWIETSLAEDVLAHTEKFPADLLSVTEEDVSILKAKIILF